MSTPKYFDNMWIDCLSEKQLLDTIGTITLKSNFGLATQSLTKEISFKEWISDINRDADDTFYFTHKNTKFYVEYNNGKIMNIGVCGNNKRYSKQLHLSWIREIIDPVLEKKADLKKNYVKYFIESDNKEIIKILKNFQFAYIAQNVERNHLLDYIKANKAAFAECLEFEIEHILRNTASMEQLKHRFGNNWQSVDELIKKLKDLIKAIYDLKPWLD